MPVAKERRKILYDFQVENFGPLHKAILNPATRLLMVKLLVANGADPNIPNTETGNTALHYAVQLDRKDLIKHLVLAGADLTAQTSMENLHLNLPTISNIKLKKPKESFNLVLISWPG